MTFPTLRFGIDLGGTKTEIIALDGDGAERLRERTPTPAHSAAAICDNIVAMIRAAEAKLGVAGRETPVGIATPGSASPATGLFRNSNSTVLNGVAVQAEIEARLGRSVAIANDANCFALSEAADGAAAGAAVVFGVIVGTGCGGGVVVNGQVLTGVNGVAGEWGHNPLPWPRDDERPGLACYCGKSGCIETWLSGTGLAKHFFEKTGLNVPSAQIAQRALEGDAKCEAALSDYEDRLARCLSAVINVLDPDVIVLGGGVSNIARLYEKVPQKLKGYVFSDVVRTQIVKAKFGDSSGVRGAAWLNPL